MSEALRPAVAAWWQWIPPLSLQGGLLLLAVASADLLLVRRSWPQLRITLWYLALVKLLLPPWLASPLSLARWLPAGEAPPLLAGSSPPAVTRWATAAVLIWLAGAALCAALWALRHRRLRRSWETGSRRQGPPWVSPLLAGCARRLGLSRLPAVRFHPGLASPFLAGALRPCLYLPADLPRELAEHALLHELAHLRRRDPWLAAAATAIACLYWFHPLVWFARRRLEELREQCCDAAVTRVLGGSPAPYRRTLLLFAARRFELPAGGLGLIRGRGPLLARLARLERAGGERTGLRRLVTAGVAASMLACCLPMARVADRAAAAVAEMVERPPGCLPLRLMVMQRLAEERSAAGTLGADP